MRPDGPSDPAAADLTARLQKASLILVWMLIGAGVLWGLKWFWPVLTWLLSTLSPFLIALVVAYVFNPIVDAVQKKLKLGRVGGILAVAGLIVLIFAAFFGFLAPVLYDQAVAVFNAVRTNLPRWAAWVGDRVGQKTAAEYETAIRRWFESLDLDPRKLASGASPVVSEIASGGATALRGAAAGLAGLFTGVTGFVSVLILVLVISFYYLLEFDAIPRLVRQVLPARTENRIMEILGKIDASLGGFLRGQLIVCAIVALAASAGLAAIGMWRYAIFVGVLAGVVNIVPYLGPVVGAAPAILWAFFSPSHVGWSSRLIHAALVILLFGAIQALDGFVLQPRVVGRSSSLHPLLVLGALVVGAQFGLGGMILAVPAACIARVLFLELAWGRRPKKN